MSVKNYRSLENIKFEANQINLLFGPNGAGKTSFLDALQFLADCATRSVDRAASDRSHGIGLLWDKAETDAHISIELETSSAIYKVDFGFSSGRIEAFVGESLTSTINHRTLIHRIIGMNRAEFYDSATTQPATIELRQPNKLALSRYLDFGEKSEEAGEVESLLNSIRMYHTRSANLDGLRTRGSESGVGMTLTDRCDNLWSVLRNLRDLSEIDDPRYQTILRFLRQGFPSVEKLFIQTLGANVVYGSYLQNNRREPIPASAVSDGQLQLLLHLVALFSEGTDPTIIAFDEPEVSLHPYAIAVFADAVKEATARWNKQVFIATHSPVLISQFEAVDIIATELGEKGQTLMNRVSEMMDIQDLLNEYATGSLYMAELIAPQSELVSN